MNSIFLIYSVWLILAILAIGCSIYFSIIKPIITKRDALFLGIGVFLLVNSIGLGNTGYEINEKLSFNMKAPDGIYSTSDGDSVVTPKKLYQYLLNTRISNPEVIYCQAIIESNSFKSELYKRNRNLFGMKLPEARVTSGSAVTGIFQKYANYRESVADYMLWAIQNQTSVLTEDQYINYLQKIYAEDPNYAVKIRKMLKETDFKKLEE